MEAKILSDARFGARAKIRQARAMSPEMKFRAGGDLFVEACHWSLAGLAKRFPKMDESALRQRLAQLLKTQERRYQ
jgi:hypothetical protein